MFKNVKFGADPEMFIKNSDGTFIASCGKIGGTKEEPMPLGVGAVQEDNVSVEFNIPPSITKVEFVNNLSAVISEIEEKFIHPMGCELSIVPSAIFSQEELAHPAAQVFGCDPDFNVYTKESNPRPEGIQGLRTAGGHIHVGWDNPTDNQRFLLVKAMDITLGLPSLFIDDDVQRRTMYGKAGAHRIKDYGVEYRTLSNFWIRNKETMQWAYEGAVKAIALVETMSKKIDNYRTGVTVQAIINNNNKAMAERMMKQFNIEVPAL